MADKPHVEFVQAKSTPAPSGGIRASASYVFGVGGRQVVVEVHSSAVRTREGQMDPENVRIAAETFLELEAERFGWTGLPSELVLNSAAMDLVVSRLGWKPRFARMITK